jgi:hypothetical protein
MRGEDDDAEDETMRTTTALSRRQISGSLPFRAHFFRPESPSAPRKAGMAWARRMDKGSNPSENEDLGAQLNRFSSSG